MSIAFVVLPNVILTFIVPNVYYYYYYKNKLAQFSLVSSGY